jgi:hypothetical protein
VLQDLTAQRVKQVQRVQRVHLEVLVQRDLLDQQAVPVQLVLQVLRDLSEWLFRN